MSDELFDQVQRMQQRLSEVGDDITRLKVRGSNEDRTIRLTISGNLRLTRLLIDHEAFQNDPTILDEQLLATINETIERAQQQVADRLASVSGGFGGLDQ